MILLITCLQSSDIPTPTRLKSPLRTATMIIDIFVDEIRKGYVQFDVLFNSELIDKLSQLWSVATVHN